MRGWTATPSTPTALGEFGDFDGDDGIFVPAGAELDGERDAHGGADGAENFAEEIEIAKEAGAAALDNFFGGAAEIDVDGVVAEVFDHFGGASHDLRDWRRRAAR